MNEKKTARYPYVTDDEVKIGQRDAGNLVAVIATKLGLSESDARELAEKYNDEAITVKIDSFLRGDIDIFEV